jgi:hypothetical protein
VRAHLLGLAFFIGNNNSTLLVWSSAIPNLLDHPRRVHSKATFDQISDLFDVQQSKRTIKYMHTNSKKKKMFKKMMKKYIRHFFSFSISWEKLGS